MLCMRANICTRTCCVVWGSDGDVVYKRYPHVGVGLEAEGEDGGADEEHGDDAHTLQHTHISYYFFVLTSFETTIIIYICVYIDLLVYWTQKNAWGIKQERTNSG